MTYELYNIQLQSLRAGLSKLAEEVAVLKQLVQTSDSCSVSQASSSVSTSALLPSTSASVADRHSNKSALAAVHQEMADRQRRQRNVMVYGLCPSSDADDAELFLRLCEDYLECKPHIFIDPSAVAWVSGVRVTCVLSHYLLC